MIVYLDSSGIIKNLIEEPGSRELEKFMGATSHLTGNLFVTATISYAEVLATLARAKRNNRLLEEEFKQVAADFKEQWELFYTVVIDESIARLSGELGLQHKLKGCDAVQLACALESETDLFICSDKDLLIAAKENNLPSWNPAVEPIPTMGSNLLNPFHPLF